MRLSKLNRVLHRWGSVAVALPLVVVVVTGILLLLKKEIDWIQPPTAKGSGGAPAVAFDRILEAARAVPQAEIGDWDDVDRLDVRPGKGIVKVRARNRWEVQIDAQTGEVLQVAFRRSDLIESIHDGTFFHDRVKLLVFLPSAAVLFGLWATGLYLFFLPYATRWTRRRKRERSRAAIATTGSMRRETCGSRSGPSV